jgi:hypothetical protein
VLSGVQSGSAWKGSRWSRSRQPLKSLRITNQSDERIVVFNPDVGIPAPTMNWPSSNDAYQISVTDETGQELPQQAIQTWATPVIQPKLELTPDESFEMAIPIDSFYRLESGRAYWVAIEYGDQDLKVSARTRVTVP